MAIEDYLLTAAIAFPCILTLVACGILAREYIVNPGQYSIWSVIIGTGLYAFSSAAVSLVLYIIAILTIYQTGWK